ncbi:hypothetical protein CANARDRAFT_58089 [[Candida] arabinofermentans NRRL YB-2248]|uniref:Uncharacterized protein n=1 Tax=[Candida] arabinofermentans NRRL YB-2248 TaxID=983967 RepID=A0A1E4T8S5_9ASCO|nr:hypothetical protein CANARDRAFT_58089 [[Candida] arabinofermentans NRRL YB-2248]
MQYSFFFLFFIFYVNFYMILLLHTLFNLYVHISIVSIHAFWTRHVPFPTYFYLRSFKVQFILVSLSIQGIKIINIII